MLPGDATVPSLYRPSQGGPAQPVTDGYESESSLHALSPKHASHGPHLTSTGTSVRGSGEGRRGSPSSAELGTSTGALVRGAGDPGGAVGLGHTMPASTDHSRISAGASNPSASFGSATVGPEIRPRPPAPAAVPAAAHPIRIVFHVHQLDLTGEAFDDVDINNLCIEARAECRRRTPHPRAHML